MCEPLPGALPDTLPDALPDTLDIALVGVGGQGTILASNVLAELGMAAGYDVKKAEVHGMSQRGGSVVSHVRWGPEVFSPIIPAGGADILVAFEKMEAARYAALLAPGGTAIVNDFAIEPITVITGGAHYPDDAAIEAAWAAVLDRRVKAAHLEINHRAFAAGRAEMSAPAPTRPQPQTR